MFFYNEYLNTPFGLIEVRSDDRVVKAIAFVQTQKKPNISRITRVCCEQLSDYFDGKLQSFDIPMDWSSYPEFYQKVWAELMNIPYGETRSYQQLANNLNNAKAVRAVGMANGKNPIAIVVPCHRVIGSNRKLTGYAHGLAIKQGLLSLENPREYAVQKPLF